MAQPIQRHTENTLLWQTRNTPDVLSLFRLCSSLISSCWAGLLDEVLARGGVLAAADGAGAAAR